MKFRGHDCADTNEPHSSSPSSARRASAALPRSNGRQETFQVPGEIILSAGVMGSPVNLRRSGIGSGTLLNKLGIGVVVDRSGVGRHMLEHLGFSMPHHLSGHPGNNQEFQKFGLFKKVRFRVLICFNRASVGRFRRRGAIEFVDRPAFHNEDHVLQCIR